MRIIIAFTITLLFGQAASALSIDRLRQEIPEGSHSGKGAFYNEGNCKFEAQYDRMDSGDLEAVFAMSYQIRGQMKSWVIPMSREDNLETDTYGDSFVVYKSKVLFEEDGYKQELFESVEVTFGRNNNIVSAEFKTAVLDHESDPTGEATIICVFDDK